MTEIQIPVTEMSLAGKEARDILTASLNELKEVVQFQSSTTRLFFPNGIELIYIKVVVNPVEVEFKVAGKAGGEDLTAIQDSEAMS